MRIETFKDMYLAELQELLSVQDQLEEAQLRMASTASHPALKDTLSRHREETQAQKERLRTILSKHGAEPNAHTDQSMQALLKEAEKMLGLLKGNDLRDSGLVASAQKIAHYEIAAFGTAAALAGQLDLRDDQRILHQCCEEEEAADGRLTELAKREINPHAAAA